ncbi:MAG: glycosyltransferase [Chitinispirillaceae bacterium]|jgi:glycosyltransferase involved in cell wall biosynthesis
MKITIIKNYLSPYHIGGAEINVENIIKHLLLREEVDKISVITMDKNLWPKHEAVNPRLSYYRFFPLNLYFPYPMEKKRFIIIKIFWWLLNTWNPWTFIQVVRILKKEKPDVVQLHNFYGFSISVISAIQLLKIPLLFFPHDFYLICKNSSYTKKRGTVCKQQCLLCSCLTGFYKLIITKNIRTFFLSQHSAQLLCRYHPMLSGAVKHNPCMVPREIIAKNIAYRSSAAEANDPVVRFLYAGRLEKAKGILTLLDAINILKEKNVFFTLAGDGELKGSVDKFCRNSVNTKYAGFITGETKRQCFLSHDVFILPSEWFEVSPLTIIEAHAYGMPVIASRIGSIPEHIIEQKTGILFSPGNSIDLARVFSQIINNKQVVLSMRKNCFEAALSNTMDTHIDRIIQTLFSCIGNQ